MAFSSFGFGVQGLGFAVVRGGQGLEKHGL